MQSKTSINTTPTIHWISEVYKKMEDEKDKFDSRIEEPKNLKLIVDFESTDLNLPEKHMEIPVIKYKTKKIYKIEEVDLKRKSKSKNDLF